MAWIESHESLPSHPKTKRMCRLLKIKPVIAVGHLHLLWWWAMNHAQDGALDKYTPDDIADACEWEGESELFLNSLIESGFVDVTNSGNSIHDWFDYAGKLIALRQKDAERKRNARGKNEDSKDSPSDIPRTSNGNPTESIRDLNPNPNLSNKHIVDSNECDVAFESWYSIYPKQGSVRKKAYESWKSLWKEKKIDLEKIMTGTHSYIAYQNHNQYKTCGAQVFLNQQRWEDNWIIQPINQVVNFPKKQFKPNPIQPDLIQYSNEELAIVEQADRLQRERNAAARGITRDLPSTS